VLLLALLVGAGGRALWLWLDRPMERVSIRGDLTHVSADYLRSQLAPLIQGETWLAVASPSCATRRWPSTGSPRCASAASGPMP
jgi:cell division protein FtsQ